MVWFVVIVSFVFFHPYQIIILYLLGLLTNNWFPNYDFNFNTYEYKANFLKLTLYSSTLFLLIHKVSIFLSKTQFVIVQLITMLFWFAKYILIEKINLPDSVLILTIKLQYSIKIESILHLFLSTTADLIPSLSSAWKDAAN